MLILFVGLGHCWFVGWWTTIDEQSSPRGWLLSV